MKNLFSNYFELIYTKKIIQKLYVKNLQLMALKKLIIEKNQKMNIVIKLFCTVIFSNFKDIDTYDKF